MVAGIDQGEAKATLHTRRHSLDRNKKKQTNHCNQETSSQQLTGIYIVTRLHM